MLLIKGYGKLIKLNDVFAGKVDTPMDGSGRVYPRVIIQAEIVRMLQAECWLGEFVEWDRNWARTKTVLANVSHQVLDARVLEDGRVSCDVAVLDTDPGLEVQRRLKNGEKVRLFVRGHGTVGDDKIVQEGYRLEAFDIGMIGKL